MEKSSVKNIQSLQRAINIINCFTSDNSSLSIKQISEMLHLNINTTRGLINTLVHNGLLNHDKVKNEYSLGLFFLEKSILIQNRTDQFIEIAKKYAKKIAEKYKVSCSLQVVMNTEVYSIYSIHPTHSKYHITISEYESLPLHATSSGKLVLYYNMYLNDPKSIHDYDFIAYTPKTIQTHNDLEQEMQRISAKGYSNELEEFDSDVACAAFPITNSYQQLIYTISVTTFINHYKEIEPALSRDLLEISKQISHQLFY